MLVRSESNSSLTEMRLRQTILRPLLRLLGAVAVVVYLAAQTLCFLHCNIRGGGESALASCHGAQTTQACHAADDSSSTDSSSKTTTCVTLKNSLFTGDTSSLTVPQLSVLYWFDAPALLVEASGLKSQGISFRQANHSNWVFTPEMSLGPAFRSLAPPFRI